MVEHSRLRRERIDDRSRPGVGVEQLIRRQQPHLLLKILIILHVKRLGGHRVKLHVLRRPSALPPQEIEVFRVNCRVGFARALVVEQPVLQRPARASADGVGPGEHHQV